MTVMVQIRNVPDEMHRKLRQRAAQAGMSISEWLLAEVRRSLEKPARGDILARIAQRARVRPRPDTAAAVRGERESR